LLEPGKSGEVSLKKKRSPPEHIFIPLEEMTKKISESTCLFLPVVDTPVAFRGAEWAMCEKPWVWLTRRDLIEMKIFSKNSNENRPKPEPDMGHIYVKGSHGKKT